MLIEKPFGDPVFKEMPCSICIGVFDGLHLGHMQIIKTCVDQAKILNAKSVVITFSCNPKVFCNVQEIAKPIITEREFTDILDKSGVNYHCVIDFCGDISKLSGEEFIAVLSSLYDVRAMVVGNSFRCGNRQNQAGPQEIKKLLSQYTSSALLKVVPSVFINEEEVSSTLIRRCLLTGDFEKASKLLGRPINPPEGQYGC